MVMEFPRQLSPMLPTASAELPTDPERWAWELKFDGFRALVFCDGQGGLEIQSRSLRSMTFAYPELLSLARALGRPCVLDGELVAVDDSGKPNFELMQERLGFHPANGWRRRTPKHPIVYQVFDVLFLDERDLMGLPYRDRRAELERLGLAGENWLVPSVHTGPGALEVQTASRAAGLEGMVAKHLGSRYAAGQRSPAWRKVKNWSRQEFVIGGVSLDLAGAGGWLGGLLLGCSTPAGLSYCGGVEMGFGPGTVEALRELMPQLRREMTPFHDREPRPHHVYFEPALVCEVQFLEWTSLGHVRHASFKGFVFDKEPAAVARESEG